MIEGRFSPEEEGAASGGEADSRDQLRAYGRGEARGQGVREGVKGRGSESGSSSTTQS
jgi:hypothetical protein